MQIDYSLDTTGFFTAHPQAKTALEFAANQLTGRLADTLASIQPGGTNTWTLQVQDPATGLPHPFVNPTIPADTLVVYAGSRALGGSEIGTGGPAGWNASGSSAFLDTVASRGEPGARGPAAQQTDFAPAAGSVSFDGGRIWNFDLSGPRAGADDFLSVSLHELAHVLGFGTANSWRNHVSGTTFDGQASVAAFGASVPLSSDTAHWAAGVQSDGQEAAMTPSLTTGTRKLFTRLDLAGLIDTGWEPAVTHVAAAYVSGSGWTQSFRDALSRTGVGSARFGFDVTSSPAAPLPWTNLNQVSITFDRDVSVGPADLVITGAKGSIATGGFAYDPASHTATWTLSNAIAADRVRLDLRDTAAGSTLDGDADGASGGDFVRTVNVLPGDADRSGTVLATDFSQVKQKFFSSATNAGVGAAAYSVFHDVNGSGSILADDFSAVKSHFFDTLPNPAPAAVLGAAAVDLHL